MFLHLDSDCKCIIHGDGFKYYSILWIYNLKIKYLHSLHAYLKPEMVFGSKSGFPHALKESLVWQ